ncbi:MAG: sulfatase [Planctomycetes bacterium]|nr:sulfatase [Planctomycetota bacterium]
MGHLLIFATALLVLPDAPAVGAPVRTNIVLFLIDDLGWKDVRCNGGSYYQTPNVDRLAREGVRFTNAYAACALCSPTRAAIMTGKYPARLLLTEWLPSGRWNPKAKLREGRFVRALPMEEFTLAEALREAGYRTASIGKWHLGSEPFSLPQHHGFDINIAGNGHGAPGNYFFPYDGDWAIPTTGLRARWNVLPDGQPGEYLTDRLTDEAVAFIRDNGNRPFFLYLPHYAVHTPLQAKPEMIAKYEKIPEDQRQGKPAYAAMVESMDQSVGRVMDTLRELGLEQNTVVIFTSDNGGFYNATSNAPLRANRPREGTSRQTGFLASRRWRGNDAAKSRLPLSTQRGNHRPVPVSMWRRRANAPHLPTCKAQQLAITSRCRCRTSSWTHAHVIPEVKRTNPSCGARNRRATRGFVSPSAPLRPAS